MTYTLLRRSGAGEEATHGGLMQLSQASLGAG